MKKYQSFQGKQQALEATDTTFFLLFSSFFLFKSHASTFDIKSTLDECVPSLCHRLSKTPAIRLNYGANVKPAIHLISLCGACEWSQT